MDIPVKKNILGVDVTSAGKDSILQYITRSLEKDGEPYYIVTPNPEILVLASKDASFRRTVNQARIALPDGVGLTLAARLLGKPLKERIPGVDFVDELCGEVSKKPITVGFLGGRERVAEKTAECLVRKYPGLKVVFVAEEWGDEGFAFIEKNHELRIKKYEEEKHEKETISHKPYAISEIDILFVAFGFPKQEEWMAVHVGKIPVKVMMGVGGAFDYLSGSVSRAPVFLRNVGFEWLYRLICQPWRFKRQLALLSFLFLVIKERVKLS